MSRIPDEERGAPSALAVFFFVLAFLYTCYFARPVLLPVTLAFLATFLLRPVVRLLRKCRIPEPAGASLILVLLLGGLGYGAGQLTTPAIEWADRAPQTFSTLKTKMRDFVRPVQKVTKTAEEFGKITREEGGEKARVEVKTGPSFSSSLLTGMQQFIGMATVMVILLFFLLASGNRFFYKIAALFPRHAKRDDIAGIIAEIEQSISRYLVTVTLINIAEGVAVSFCLYLLGMPNPVLWGVMAALLIFIPYLGPLVGISIVAIVAVLSIPETGKALLAPLLYLGIDIIQGQILTPYILGGRFALNPVAIFLWLILWGWIWGVFGALLAVPMLTTFKILCDHVEPLRPVSDFMEK